MSAHPTDIKPGQRGVALITVLLIVAVLTAIVSRLSLSSEVWLRQVENGKALAQADQGSRAAQQWIKYILEEDTNIYDGYTDIWAQPLPPIPVGWGYLYGWMEDMQGGFNLNNLIDDEGKLDGTAMQQFERLLQIVGLNTGIAQAVVDWIDPDGGTSGPAGAEDIYYMNLEPAYMAANRPLEDISELRLVRGIDAEAWRRLEPHVSALPRGTRVNVNTTTPETLAAMVTEWGAVDVALALAQRWTAQVQTNPFATLEIFADEALGSRDNIPSGLSVTSQYFLAHTQLGFDQIEYRMATLYQRDGGRASIVRHNRELR